MAELLAHLGCTENDLTDFGTYKQEDGSYINYEHTSDLRDAEYVPLCDTIHRYYLAEVKPHVEEAWVNMDSAKIGYEISFNKYFYRHKPLRSLEAVTADIVSLEKQADGLIADILGRNAVTKGLNPDTPMKDSGIDWIGDIPAHWNIKPGLDAFSENKRNNKGMKNDQVLSLSYGNIIIKPKEKMVGLVPESFETYQIIDAGDIIIRGTDLQNDKTSLRTGLAKNEGIITSAYLSLRVSQNYNSRFLHYYLHTLDTSKVIYKFGTGLRQNLSFEDFKRLPVLAIPKSLQVSIADFLDDKTAKIDEAVKIKRRQIELLAERKQILIQNAVTKGLIEAHTDIAPINV